jgi:hypothetical protein
MDNNSTNINNHLSSVLTEHKTDHSMLLKIHVLAKDRDNNVAG